MAAKAVTIVNANQTHKGAPKTVVTTTFAATDSTEGGTMANTGRELLLLQTGAAEREVTFNDKKGVSVGKSKLAESTTSAFGPFDVGIYGTTLSFKSSNNAVLATAIKLTHRKTIQITT